MVVLQPGQYDASQLGLGGVVKPSLGAAAEARPVFLCTVSQRPIVTTFSCRTTTLLKDESGDIPVPGEGKWDVEGAVPPV